MPALSQKFFKSNMRLFIQIISIFTLISTITTENLRKAIPPESSFIPLGIYTPSNFVLTDKLSEAYFSYENNNADSDLIFRFSNSNLPTVHMYLYEKYGDIKIDDQGNYTDFLVDFILDQQSFIIKTKDIPIIKTKYFIIIKDLANSNQEGSISLFNEADIVPLSTKSPFIYSKFSSKNAYTLQFTAELDEFIYLKLDTDNSTFEHNITILLNDTQSIYEGIRTKGLIELNSNHNLQGTFKIYLRSEGELYQNVNAFIMLTKQKRKVLKLVANETMELNYHGVQIFNFYVDLNEYELNEENMLTFKFQHEVSKNDLLKYCYALTKNLYADSDNILLEYMPKKQAQNEGKMAQFAGTDNVYHLYFKKTLEKEAEKSGFLLIQLSLGPHDEEAYTLPQKFSLFLGNRMEKINLSSKEDTKIQIKNVYNLKGYTPKLLKVNINTEDKDKFNKENMININQNSFVFFTDHFIQSVFTTSLLDADYKAERQGQIFAVDKSSVTQKNNESLSIIIKLFSFVDTSANFMIESTTSNIYYDSQDTREQKSYGQEVLNCKESLYFIGNYGLSSRKNHFYLENIYGDFNIYYKESISSEDNAILTNEDEKYLVKDYNGLLGNHYSILEFKCTFPGYLNLYILSPEQTSNVELYNRVIDFLEQGTEYSYSLKAPENTTNLYAEISTPLGIEIQVEAGSEKVTIGGSNSKFYLKKFDSQTSIPSSIRLLSANSGAVVSIRFSEPKKFEVIEETFSYTNGDALLIKLNKTQEFKSVNFMFNHVLEYYSIYLYKGDPNCATLPSLMKFNFLPSSYGYKNNKLYSNPYEKYPQIDTASSENNNYYLLLEYNNSEPGLQKTINLTYNVPEHYDPLPINSLVELTRSSKKMSIEHNQEAANLTVMYQSCGNSVDKVNIYNYDSVLQEISNKNNKLNFLIFTNYKISMQLEGVFNQENINSQYEGLEVAYSYDQISEEKLNKFNEQKNVTQNGKKISWDKLENVKQYQIFVFSVNSTYEKYMTNLCFLNQVIKNKTEFYSSSNDNSTNETIKTYITEDDSISLDEEGSWKVVVLAVLEGNTPVKYLYEILEYDSKVKKTSYLWLYITIPLIIIIVIILVVVLIRKKNTEPAIKIPDKEDEALVRYTTDSNTTAERLLNRSKE